MIDEMVRELRRLLVLTNIFYSRRHQIVPGHVDVLSTS